MLTDPAETGAVTISLPEDVQSEVFDWPEQFLERRVWRVRRPVPGPGCVAEVARLSRRRSDHSSIVGGGAIYAAAEAELDTFATGFGIPVSESQAGKGALPWNHPHECRARRRGGRRRPRTGWRRRGPGDRRRHAPRRLRHVVEAMFQDPEVRFVGININGVRRRASCVPSRWWPTRERPYSADRWLSRRPGYAGTTASYRERIGDLQGGVGRPGRRSSARPAARPRTWLSPRSSASSTTPSAAMPRSCAPPAACRVTCSSCGVPEDSKAYHLEYGYSCMGYEIRPALGVKLAEPEREVVVAIGDGTYLMLNSEIVTAVAEGIRITVVVFDNHGFQCIKDLATSVGVPQFGNELRFRDPDRDRLTGDVRAGRLRQARGSYRCDRRARPDRGRDPFRPRGRPDGRRITVIHVPVSPDKRTPGDEGWWDVPPAEVEHPARRPLRACPV